MTYTKKSPAALAGAHRAVGIPSISNSDITPTSPEYQTISIIAKRYKLTFPRARLICDLARIGERSK